jgi:hypothetical protein
MKRVLRMLIPRGKGSKVNGKTQGRQNPILQSPGTCSMEFIVINFMTMVLFNRQYIGIMA